MSGKRAATQYDVKLAKQYNSESIHEHPQNFLPYATLLKRVGSIAGQEVLDLACGGGFGSRLLAERGARVTAADISPDMIADGVAREKAKPLGIKYLVRDAAALDLGRTFNTLTAMYLFNYGFPEKNLDQLVGATARHLTPGGQLFALTTPAQPLVPMVPNASHWTEWID